jgi:microcystin-dependent protein
MKNIFLFLSLLFTIEQVGAACSSPISRANVSANTVLTSTKYNTDLNTVYSKVNSLPGDCIVDATVTTAKIADESVTSDKLAPGVLSGFIPTGTILPYAGTSAPTGFLLCNGSTVSRTTYADLYAVVGDSFGSGNGSTTFHLPDLKGRFLRGVDGGAGRDPDRLTRTAMNLGGNSGDQVGSVQDDAFQGHYHQFSGTFSVSDSAITPANYVQATAASTTSSSSTLNNQNYVNTPRTGLHGTARFTNETRPQNANVNFIIKY